MQAMHPDENRLAGTTRSRAAGSLVYGSLAVVTAAQGPRLLDPGLSMAESLQRAAPSLGRAALDVVDNVMSGAGNQQEIDDELEGAYPPALASDTDDEMPDLMSECESEDNDDTLGADSEVEKDATVMARGSARLQAAVHVARQIRAARRDDGMERGAVGGSSRPHSVFWTSTAARIRAYYETMPEASQSVVIVDPAVANRPSRVSSPALRGALRF